MKSFRTGVQLPPPPPKVRQTNTRPGYLCDRKFVRFGVSADRSGEMKKGYHFGIVPKVVAFFFTFSITKSVILSQIHAGF